MKRKMNKIFAVATMLMLTEICLAQTTSLPYSTGFENNNPPSWQVFRKGAQDPTSIWTLNTVGAYAGTKYLYHGYPTSGTTVTDDWYVSPPFAFTTGGNLDSFRASFAGFGMPDVGDTVAIYLLTGSADPALATSKKLLLDFRGSNYQSGIGWKKFTGITIPNTPGTSYIAFRYRTVNNWMDVSFDNLSVSGKGGASGVFDNSLGGRLFKVSTCPTCASLTIENAIGANASLLNGNGQQVLQVVLNTENVTTDISSLPVGIYFLLLKDKLGNHSIVKVLKN